MEANVLSIYYYLAIFATIVFAIKLAIFTIFGFDHEVSGDFTAEIDADPSFNFLSLQAILAFLMGFGWAGYASLGQFKATVLISSIYAFITGLIFMAVTAFLMFSIRKLEKNVKKDKNSAVNKIGKAYTNFQPKGQGQIEIEINGQLSVAEAINLQDEEIKSFEQIKVVKVENEVMYIEKV